MHLSFTKLIAAVRGAAAIRRIQRLQPVGGVADVLFPPTYPAEWKGKGVPPRHVFERRRHVEALGGGSNGDGAHEVWTVLLDSVQSQANRLEEALRDSADDGLPVPFVSVNFRGQGLEPLERITSLDAPHRVYDAILRDSSCDGRPFMDSEPGRRLAAAKLADATALLELSPNALLFGSWHSQGREADWGRSSPGSSCPRSSEWTYRLRKSRIHGQARIRSGLAGGER